MARGGSFVRSIRERRNASDDGGDAEDKGNKRSAGARVARRFSATRSMPAGDRALLCRKRRRAPWPSRFCDRRTVETVLRRARQGLRWRLRLATWRANSPSRRSPPPVDFADRAIARRGRRNHRRNPDAPPVAWSSSRSASSAAASSITRRTSTCCCCSIRRPCPARARRRRRSGSADRPPDDRDLQQRTEMAMSRGVDPGSAVARVTRSPAGQCAISHLNPRLAVGAGGVHPRPGGGRRPGARQPISRLDRAVRVRRSLDFGVTRHSPDQRPIRDHFAKAAGWAPATTSSAAAAAFAKSSSSHRFSR